MNWKDVLHYGGAAILVIAGLAGMAGIQLPGVHVDPATCITAGLAAFGIGAKADQALKALAVFFVAALAYVLIAGGPVYAQTAAPNVANLQTQINALQAKVNAQLGTLNGRLPFPVKAPAMAAPFSWGGAYIGADIGYGFAARELNLLPANDSANAVFVALGNPGSLNPKAAGPIGGFHAGFNYLATQNLLLGVEAGWEWANLNASLTRDLAAQASLATQWAVDWDGSLDARVGAVIAPNAMIYAMGGMSIGNISQGAGLTCTFGAQFCFSNATDNTHVGWNIGAGLEYAVAQNIILRGEYRYVDLGNQSFTMTGGGVAPASFNASTTAAWNEVRGGMSYKF